MSLFSKYGWQRTNPQSVSSSAPRAHLDIRPKKIRNMGVVYRSVSSQKKTPKGCFMDDSDLYVGFLQMGRSWVSVEGSAVGPRRRAALRRPGTPGWGGTGATGPTPLRGSLGAPPPTRSRPDGRVVQNIPGQEPLK